MAKQVQRAIGWVAAFLLAVGMLSVSYTHLTLPTNSLV